MKSLVFLVLAVLIAAGAWAGVGASKSTANQPDLTRLQRDVALLKSQVGGLKRQVATLNKQVSTLKQQVTDARTESNINYTGDGCGLAATADLFIATWSSLDAFAQQVAQKPIFGAQPAFDDKGACGSLRNPLVPRQTAVPPSFSTYNALLTWINP